jgi:gamma-glutamyltranspeptidase/glutathione hydrolase
MGHAQVIAFQPENSVFAGAADPRCDGLAMGY